MDCVGIDDGIVLSSAVNDMQINADFDKRVVQPPPRPEDWVPSPMTGAFATLPGGRTKLQAWFKDKEGNDLCGAFYVTATFIK